MSFIGCFFYGAYDFFKLEAFIEQKSFSRFTNHLSRDYLCRKNPVKLSNPV